MSENEKFAESRRSFLKRGAMVAGGAAALSTLAAPAVLAQAPLVLRTQTAWGSGQIFFEMAGQFASKVEAMTGGRIRFEMLPNNAVVGAFSIMQAVSDGTVDAGHQVPVYWYGLHRAASFFGTGPVFGGDAQTQLAWYYKDGKAFYEELIAKLGLNVVTHFGMPMPAQPLGWFKNPILDAAQLNGLSYRTVGLAADLFQQMGVTVSQLPGGEIVPAMERGVIDAFEFNNPTDDRRFGSPDVAKNYMLGSFHQASEYFEIDINSDVWADIDPVDQAIIAGAVEASAISNLMLAKDNYSKDLEEMARDQGVTVYKTADSILQRQIEAWDAIIPILEAEDEINKRIMDSQKEWTRRVSYYEQMNQPNLKLAYDHYFPGVLPA